jgi:hypothetical protein
MGDASTPVEGKRNSALSRWQSGVGTGNAGGTACLYQTVAGDGRHQ